MLLRAKVFALIITPFLAASCSQDGSEDAGGSTTLKAAIDMIDSELQQRESLVYLLLCSATPEGELKEAARLDSLKATPLSSQPLAFKPQEAVSKGMFCRVEVRSLAGDYSSDYNFDLSAGLFYASILGEVIDGSDSKPQLKLKVYKVYEDLLLTNLAVNVKAKFPSNSDDTFTIGLVCGEESFNAAPVKVSPAVAAVEVKIYVPLAKLANDGLPCEEITAASEDKKTSLLAEFSEAFILTENFKELIEVGLTPVAPDRSVD